MRWRRQLYSFLVDGKGSFSLHTTNTAYDRIRSHGIGQCFRLITVSSRVNSFLPGQIGRHFADDIFKRLLMNEKLCISIRISLKFVPKGPIDNKSALVQVMAWCRTGNKLLPEPMMSQFTDAYMRHKGDELTVHFLTQINWNERILIVLYFKSPIFCSTF